PRPHHRRGTPPATDRAPDVSTPRPARAVSTPTTGPDACADPAGSAALVGTSRRAGTGVSGDVAEGRYRALDVVKARVQGEAQPAARRGGQAQFAVRERGAVTACPRLDAEQVELL